MLREKESITIEDYYQYSIAWLEVSDAILVVPGSEESKGTQKEIDRANELKIPVFYTIRDLVIWNIRNEKHRP